ncbi:MAG: NAD(P)H-hydrate epimerase [Anaerolineales bacterium]|nr:MAG: NAD(P)H-hydrate epimerase [Anaerolineales bacterium]
MIPAITIEQMIEIDRLMIENYGILLIQMMENAGQNLAEMGRRMCAGDLSAHKIVVLCGGGNNGGGGMVATRHLHNRGAHVWIGYVGNPQKIKEIPAHQWNILKEMGISASVEFTEPPFEPALVVDAMIGYGLQGNPRPEVGKWIDWVNATGAPVLALDTPSGLNTSTGQPGQPCVRATATLTLALPKIGLLNPKATPFVGELFLADIGVPPELYRSLDLEVPKLFLTDTIVKVDRKSGHV